MAYINSDGSIGNKPWYLCVTGFFTGFINFITMFFQTLINPGMNLRGNQYTTDYRRPGNPPPPPRKRLGGFKTLSDCPSPPMGGG